MGNLQVGFSPIHGLNKMVTMNACGNGTLVQSSAHKLKSEHTLEKIHKKRYGYPHNAILHYMSIGIEEE